MGLITLLNNPSKFKFYTGQGYSGNGDKSSQKNLKYGKDTIGGGYSGQPYIQTPIPNGFNNLGPSTDFILRGGSNALKDSLTDVERLTKMFGDLKSPNGLLFVAKQQLLSRTAVRTQTSDILNEGVYLPLNTLAQAGVIMDGYHLNKQGNPFANTGAYATGANNEYLYNVKVNSTKLLTENRLYQLSQAALTQQPKDFGKGVKLNNGANVMTYTGGPGSVLGAGNTGIRYSLLSKTPLTANPLFFNFTKTPQSIGQNVWVYSSRLTADETRPILSYGIASPKIQDFRQILRDKLQGQDKTTATNSGATTNSQNYNIGNFEQRVNIGNPGQRSDKSYADYSLGVLNKSDKKSAYASFGINDGGLDKINSLPIYRSKAVTTDDVVNDFVNFRIAVIDNDDPNFKTFMHFRAFLGPISDNYNATWNPVQYLGRGEQFYTYGGFTRQLSLSWTVAAQSKQELIPMYKKLNYLASTLTPNYSADGYMRGNLVQLTIGGYLYEQPGFITSLTYQMEEDSPWEIGIGTSTTNVEGDPTVKELCQIIRVTGFSFTPIHNFIPQKQILTFATNTISDTSGDAFFALTDGDQRYIALENEDNNNYNTLVPNKKESSTPATPSSRVSEDPSAGIKSIVLGQGRSAFPNN